MSCQLRWKITFLTLWVQKSLRFEKGVFRILVSFVSFWPGTSSGNRFDRNSQLMSSHSLPYSSRSMDFVAPPKQEKNILGLNYTRVRTCRCLFWPILEQWWQTRQRDACRRLKIRVVRWVYTMQTVRERSLATIRFNIDTMDSLKHFGTRLTVQIKAFYIRI